MDAEFLKLVRCPITLTKLSPADERLLAAVNRKIDAGQLSNRIGQAVTEPLQAGLVNEDASWLMAVIDGIAVLVADQAIDLSQVDDIPTREEGEP